MSRSVIVLRVLILVGFALCTLPPHSAIADMHRNQPKQIEDELEGRWDLTTTQGDLSFPQWLEIYPVDGEEALRARFMPRIAGVIDDIPVQLSGNNVSFGVPIWPLYQLAFQIPQPQLDFSGTFVDGRLIGTVTGPLGSLSTWEGVKAPKLKSVKDYAWLDPIVLFDGVNLDSWTTHNTYSDVDFTQFGIFDYGDNWTVTDGVLRNNSFGYELRTVEEYQDFHLHSEVRFPVEEGNSGIYLRGRYEVQILDSPIATDDPSFDPTTMRTGAIYSLIAPKADATNPAGQWQELDITLLGRRVTVVVNGEVVVKNRKIPGITGGAIDSNEAMPGPILLQGSETAVEYRNIVLKPAMPIN